MLFSKIAGSVFWALVGAAGLWVFLGLLESEELGEPEESGGVLRTWILVQVANTKQFEVVLAHRETVTGPFHPTKTQSDMEIRRN